jgi:hypothetical protein
MAMENVSLHNPAGFDLDLDMLRDFERGLDPLNPERSTIPARVLGYGEISTVFEIQVDGMEKLAFKRLPLFYSAAELDDYRAAYDRYIDLLESKIGLRLPLHGYAAFPDDAGRPIFYIIQQQEQDHAIGHKAIHHLPDDQVVTLVTRLLREMRRVWDFNRGRPALQVALDGQISNWVIKGLDLDHPSVGDSSSFLYLDTSTPLFQVDDVEQLDPELFLRSAPSFLRWVLRLFFLDDVINRYYDFHLVTVDMIAQFYKEQRPELIPALVAAANAFFAGEGAELDVAPLTEDEIRAYYREDALIWRLYLGLRRFDRFLHRWILRRHYPYILPGRIKR